VEKQLPTAGVKTERLSRTCTINLNKFKVRSRESRALSIIKFFIDNPIPYKRAAKVFYPSRERALLMRVFKNSNDYDDEDLRVWELIIKQIREYDKKVKKEAG
jgi:hypothetical protein